MAQKERFSDIWSGAPLEKTGGIRRLEKVLGTLDGRGCLGKVLMRLHARLLGGLGWVWCLGLA